MEKTKHNYALDFLKVIAASIIVFHHFQLITEIRFSNFVNFYGEWFNWGFLVELFFIISGYFMYRYIFVLQNEEITLLDWWKKRAIRLLPMSAITVLVYELILFANVRIFGWAIWGVDVSIWEAVVAALGIQEGWVFVNPFINSSLWYISVLMACYIIFYMLTVLAKRIKCNPMYFYVAMILLGLGVGVYGGNWPFFNWQIARGYYAFFFGLLLASYVKTYGINKGAVTASIISVVFFVLMFAFYPQYTQKFTNYMLTFLLFPAVVILFETKVAGKIFRHKVWGTLSAISFEVYLWHMPTLLLAYFVMNCLKIPTDFTNKSEGTSLALMFGFLLITWIVGTLMYFFAERPIVKRLTRKKVKEVEDAEKAQEEQ